MTQGFTKELGGSTTATPNTVTLRDGSGDTAFNAVTLVVATGTAPLTITSTTLVANLNADQVDGLDAVSFLQTASASTDLTSNGMATWIQPSATRPSIVMFNIGLTSGATTAARVVLYVDETGLGSGTPSGAPGGPYTNATYGISSQSPAGLGGNLEDGGSIKIPPGASVYVANESDPNTMNILYELRAMVL